MRSHGGFAWTMRAAFALGIALVAAAAPALADSPWKRGHHHGPRHEGPRHDGPRHWGYRPPPYYAPPPRVYYAPPPVYYAPPPIYYAPPMNMAPGLSFGLNIPLR